MKLGVLFSGGKDSAYALYKAMQKEEVACLISIVSENKESYMFHTPNIDLTKLQAEAIGLPLIQKKTIGIKEDELSDLKEAIAEAVERFGIEGVVTGAVESVYQATRIQRICSELGLRCFNPLWQKDQLELLKEIVALDFDVIISGVFAYPLNKDWLDQKIDDVVVGHLKRLMERYQISPTGEGGEIETTVLDAPFFKKRIAVKDYEKHFDGMSGTLEIKKAMLERKGRVRAQETTQIPMKAERKEEIAGAGHGTNSRCSEEIYDTLIIDMNEKKDSLSKDEFVLPIARTINYRCFVRHWSEVSNEDLKKCKRVIMSGNPLGDVSTTKHLDNFSWLKCFDKPVLGICAGHHTIAAVFGAKLIKNEKIGMNEISVKKENRILPHDIEAYELHGHAIEKPGDFDIIAESENCIEAIKHKKREIYGVQFHPEVRNWAILERFVLL
ncbi:MAG: TIGR00289 family protein [Candidatus Micrarchaeota archaeon]|nr:TIGR00289 family protein [Candidatus Micrarchaeota archaeon]